MYSTYVYICRLYYDSACIIFLNILIIFTVTAAQSNTTVKTADGKSLLTLTLVKDSLSEDADVTVHNV